jgi:hypothetical protein
MGKSKKRGGETAHRIRVAARNQMMKGLWQKQVNLAYEKHEIWKQEQAAKTQSEETKINVA